jgi:chaperone required for assembly of F1-ATPase
MAHRKKPGSESAKRISPEPVSQGLPDTVQRAPPESPAYVFPKRKPAWIGSLFLLAFGLIALAGIVGYLAFWHPQSQEVHAPQEIPSLSVIVEPAGSSILLDGKLPQVPPNTFTYVSFGSHQITAALDGYESIRQNIEVRPGMAPQIRLQLKPTLEIAALSVLSEPAGASILLDGKPPQSPPNTFTHVPFGPHQITATLEDYEPVKQNIEVRRGMAPQLHLQLKPIEELTALSVATEPAGASILLDGKSPQVPPNTFTHVPFGTHQLTATLDHYEPIKQDIEVRKGMSPEIRLQLQQRGQEIAALSVQTEPAGAAILLDGKPPQAPSNTFTHVPFGTHQLTATLDDYEPIKQDIQVRRGMTPQIHLQLRSSASSSWADTPIEHIKHHGDSDKLPTFFPPRATDSVVLSFQFASKNWTLQNVAEHLDAALRNAGYWGKCSYYWLDDRHGPGFAIVTHIEHIQPDGKPVLDQRWGFDLPRYGQITLVSMLKALINADPGRYRLLALVVCKEPLVEKETPMTPHQVQELNAGPKWFAESPLKTVIPTEDFHLIAYVYEFERKSRSDDPALMVSSNLTAEQHLRSTALYDDIEKYLSK